LHVDNCAAYLRQLTCSGAIAQLGERIVRNDEVVGSSPTSSTIFSIICSFPVVQFCPKLVVVTTICLYPSSAFAAGNRFRIRALIQLEMTTIGSALPPISKKLWPLVPMSTARYSYRGAAFSLFSDTTSLYTPFSGTQTADAIVGDTTFELAGGTTCYNPQNESNIVINPTNPKNVVT